MLLPTLRKKSACLCGIRHADQVRWPRYHVPDRKVPPMYPSTPTTYKLPFDDTVSVSSKCRYVLVRIPNIGDAPKPFIVRRSDNLPTLERIYDPATDYIIDQARGFVTYHFNGRQETFDGIDGRHLYGPGPFVVYHSLHGGRQVM